MTIFQAIVLGALQGLAEFLPISSSAHLSLAPWAFGWPEPGLPFDVALHVGTLVAVVGYFWREWIALIHGFVRLVVRRRIETAEARRILFLIGATVPGALAGVLLKDQAEGIFRTPALTATALIVVGAILWVVDARASSARPLGSMRWADAILIGISQAFAIVPGVSRAGATMTAGRALGFDRGSAATFSFMMSVPIIAAAATLEFPRAFAQGGSLAVVVGMVTAAITGWLAIAGLLRFVQRRGFAVFAIYRFVLGAAVLILVAIRAAP